MRRMGGSEDRRGADAQGSGDTSSTRCGFIDGMHAIRMMPKMLRSIPTKNHPNALRPFEKAIIDVITPERIHKTTSSIASPPRRTATT